MKAYFAINYVDMLMLVITLIAQALLTVCVLLVEWPREFIWQTLLRYDCKLPNLSRVVLNVN